MPYAKYCAALLLLIVTSLVHAQQNVPFIIGVSDSNGIIMPFALYDGGRWTNPWPQNDYNVISGSKPEKMHERMEEIPKTWYSPLGKISDKWNTIYQDGRKGVMEVSKPALVYSWCIQRWALIGEASQKENVGSAGDFYRLSRDLFLATTSQQIALGMKLPDKQSDEYHAVYQLVDEAISTSEAARNHPVPASDRKGVKTELATIVRNETAQDGFFIYYVEAKKDFSNNNSNRCISYFNGWILKDSKNKLSFMNQDFIIYRNEMIFIQPDIPLGILGLDGHSYWIIRDMGYEGESRLILDVSPSEIKRVLQVPGGGC